ncbi:MAG: hypothetical protein LBN08_05575 [Lactobacillales bacterium]|nr:hypothetical protein [Lactobacillales bacterium]
MDWSKRCRHTNRRNSILPDLQLGRLCLRQPIHL